MPALSVASAGGRAAWFAPYRTLLDLVLEDCARGERKRVATEPFTGHLALFRDGRFAFGVAAGLVVVLDLPSGARRVLGPGTRVVPSPDSDLLAVEDGDEVALWSRESGERLSPPRPGRHPVWSPCGARLGYLSRVEDGAWQAFVLGG